MSASRVRSVSWPRAIAPITAARLAMLFPVGQRVRGRLLAKLDEEKYLLRLKGHNLIARSSVDLDEGEPISALVVSTWPRLHLQIQQRDKGAPNGGRASGAEANSIAADEKSSLRFGPVRVDIRV
jgi:hypothetical protein